MQTYTSNSTDARLHALYVEQKQTVNQIEAVQNSSKDESVIHGLLQVINRINAEKKQLASEVNHVA